MLHLDVQAELIGTKLHRLSIFHNGTFIGEYERSQKKDIKRKTREIHLASTMLLNIYNTYGLFIVRWNGNAHKKSIRVNEVEVGHIPKEFWQKPSWG